MQIWRAPLYCHAVAAKSAHRAAGGDYRGHARWASVVARKLADQDIDDVAAYYAAIPVTVGPPPK